PKEPIEHDPEKWIPVFGRDHAPTKKLTRDDDSRQTSSRRSGSGNYNPVQAVPSLHGIGARPQLSVSAAAAQHRFELAVGAEIIDALDRHQFGETSPRPIDAALDCADGAAADARRLLVGESGSADQHERLALIRGQLGERRAELLELDAARLLGL